MTDMNDIMMKKKFLKDAMKRCEIEILRNLVGHKVTRLLEGVVVKVEVNEEDPPRSVITYITTKGNHKYAELYANLRVYGYYD